MITFVRMKPRRRKFPKLKRRFFKILQQAIYQENSKANDKIREKLFLKRSVSEDVTVFRELTHFPSSSQHVETILVSAVLTLTHNVFPYAIWR